MAYYLYNKTIRSPTGLLKKAGSRGLIGNHHLNQLRFIKSLKQLNFFIMKKIQLTTRNYKSRKLSIFVALTLFCAAVSIESSAQFGLALGPKAGVSITTLKGADATNIEERTNWLGGIFLNVQITPGFNLQPELLFSQKGADFTSNNVRTNLVVNYFEIPVLAKLRLPIGEVFYPHILFGPNFAYRTKVQYTRTETLTGTAITTNNDDIRKSDIGGLVGGGIDFQTRHSGLFLTVDGRYGFGFNNLNRSDNSIEIRNVGWSFSLGVGFLLR